MKSLTLSSLLAALAVLSAAPDVARAQTLHFKLREEAGGDAPQTPQAVPDAAEAMKVLSADQWRRVDRAVERALDWMASQQQRDGSFPTLPRAQPGVTSLAILAYLVHGHRPGEGPYGQRLERAVDYVISCQRQNGLLTLIGPNGPRIERDLPHEIGVAAAYDHAISAVALSEVYGMTGAKQAKRIEAAIVKALDATFEMQYWPKDRPIDRGGWRYIDTYDAADSDLSITGWQIMFLRSARNAGFNVPKQRIDEAVAYVRRCYDPQYGAFVYTINMEDDRSRAMAGAGILALAHAGFHGAPEAKRSAEWILRHPFDVYNREMEFTRRRSSAHDRYHYSVFNCCQAMYQLGGRYWEEFFPRTVRTLLAHQQRDGSWPVDGHAYDGQFGNIYTTALVVMSLGAPNQLLPVFQR